jgi:hypothetical protein
MSMIMVYPSGPYDRITAWVSPSDAVRMVREKQAEWIDERRRAVRLSAGSERCGRTRISSGGMLAAIGRSQKYTIREHFAARVAGTERIPTHGFKTIFPEDARSFGVVRDRLIAQVRNNAVKTTTTIAKAQTVETKG